MKKRIFRYMNLLVFVTVLTFAVFGLLFSRNLGTEIQERLRTLRVTMISNSGAVTYDNQSDTNEMDNHLERPEVKYALKKGHGESERYSETLGETTYYYALRLKDNDVLRIALTTQGMQSILFKLLPFIILCLILAALFSFFLARHLTKRIIAPINEIDLGNPEIGNYEELLPFVKKIQTQKQELAVQVTDLEKREGTIKTITENMQEGLLLLDEAGKIMLANQSALEILAEPEATGKNIVLVCREPEFIEALKKVEIEQRAETTIKRHGRTYNVFFNTTKENETNGIVVLFIDVTEKFVAEKQRQEFSANVSHELKTPLTTISALAEMIEDGTAKPEDVAQFAHKINVQTERLNNIISDIIKLSEFDEGELTTEFTGFNLRDLVDDVIREQQVNADQREITIVVQSKENIIMTANRRMIAELLNNLISNAIKYNRLKGKVTVNLTELKDAVEISVTDAGIGISVENKNRIFERFYRVDKSRSKKTGGTGLGLSIVKHVVEFHHGNIQLESEEGSGTTINVIIPNASH